MKVKRWARPSALFAALALAAAACGAQEEEPQAGQTPGSPTGTEQAAGGANVNGTLEIGTLVPETGDLSALGPPQQLAYELAVQQINEAGGVLGNNVVIRKGDSGTNEQIANNAVDAHLRSGVDTILGAASSRISLSVINKITGANVVQCSPSNTSDTFTTIEQEEPGFYIRTAPPDTLQAPALAQVITGEGFSQVAIMALNDAYGQGFAKNLVSALEDMGASVVANVAYDPTGTEFEAEVQKLAQANPEAVALISFPDTGSSILRSMIARGLGPDQIGVFTADGMQTADIGAKVNPDNPAVMAGLKGTAPSSQGSQAFTDQFREFAPPDTAQIFSAHAYDCANIVALAAQSAGTDDPTQWNAEVLNVVNDGEQCNDFASCKQLLDQDQDIDYEGATGVDFVPAGEPKAGTYEVWELQCPEDECAIETLRTVTIGEEQQQ